MKPIKSSGRCRSDVLYIQIINHICRGGLRTTLITLCWVLANDIHINILKFIAGHGAVVQPASINIVFGYKKEQHCSRKHQLGLSELTAGVHIILNRVGRTCIPLLPRAQFCCKMWGDSLV